MSKSNPLKWNWNLVGQIIQEYAETFFLLLFIVNGVATSLIMFNWVEAGDKFKFAVGALAFAFSVLAMMYFTYLGVKHRISNKKG